MDHSAKRNTEKTKCPTKPEYYNEGGDNIRGLLESLIIKRTRQKDDRSRKKKCQDIHDSQALARCVKHPYNTLFLRSNIILQP